MKKLAILLWILILGYTPVFASEIIISHFWEADSQTKAGKVVTCFLQLTAVNLDQILMTMNLSLMAEKVEANRVRILTMLKITAARITETLQSVPIKLHHGWLRTSSGTSIGNFTKIDVKPDPYFLAGASGMDLFAEITKGALKDGVTVGFQEKPGTFDKVYKISDPPPLDITNKFLSCFVAMSNDISTSK